MANRPEGPGGARESQMCCRECRAGGALAPTKRGDLAAATSRALRRLRAVDESVQEITSELSLVSRGVAATQTSMEAQKQSIYVSIQEGEQTCLLSAWPMALTLRRCRQPRRCCRPRRWPQCRRPRRHCRWRRQRPSCCCPAGSRARRRNRACECASGSSGTPCCRVPVGGRGAARGVDAAGEERQAATALTSNSCQPSPAIDNLVAPRAGPRLQRVRVAAVAAAAHPLETGRRLRHLGRRLPLALLGPPVGAVLQVRLHRRPVLQRGATAASKSCVSVRTIPLQGWAR